MLITCLWCRRRRRCSRRLTLSLFVWLRVTLASGLSRSDIVEFGFWVIGLAVRLAGVRLQAIMSIACPLCVDKIVWTWRDKIFYYGRATLVGKAFIRFTHELSSFFSFLFYHILRSVAAQWMPSKCIKEISSTLPLIVTKRVSKSAKFGVVFNITQLWKCSKTSERWNKLLV